MGTGKIVKPFSRAGFTLLEVLVAFAILVSALTLTAALFRRHIEAAQRLERSVCARHLADQRLLEEFVRRRQEVEPASSVDPEGFAAELSVEPLILEAEPLKGLPFERAVARVVWEFRRRSESIALSAGLGERKQGK